MPGKIYMDVELTPAELADFTRVEPPAFLDGLVKQRAGEVLERRRAQLADTDAAAAAALSPVAHRLNGAEACAYAFGLLAYGIQLADGVARLIWHAMTG